MPNQIAFYPQTSGGAPGAMQLIQKQVATAGNPVTFSSIPQTFTHLLLVMAGATSNGGGVQNVFIQFNGDVGANYYYVFMDGTFNAVNSGFSAATTAGIVGQFDNGLTACTIQAFIGAYTSTAFQKTVVGNGTPLFPASNYHTQQWGSAWANTAAITGITLTCNSVVAGSVFSLYGLS